MADEAFVFIERVLLAEQALLVLSFGVTDPAAILVSFVLLAPEPAFLAQLRIANEAVGLRDFMRFAHVCLGTWLFLVAIFVLSHERLAAGRHQERAEREQE